MADGATIQCVSGTVQPGGADVKGGPFRRVHVLDRHVEVDLLRVRRIRPAWRGVVLHLLNITGCAPPSPIMAAPSASYVTGLPSSSA